jgi:hypothetical protein
MNHLEHLYKSKYHFSIVERMLETYELFPDKRVFLGIINESYKSVISIINAYIALENQKFNKISAKYLSDQTSENLFKIIEIEKAQKNSPIEFQKEQNIILLINGEYKILTVERLKEFINSLKTSISKFPKHS